MLRTKINRNKKNLIIDKALDNYLNIMNTSFSFILSSLFLNLDYTCSQNWFWIFGIFRLFEIYSESILYMEVKKVPSYVYL